MSFAGKRYSENATFFTPIIPGEDYWDRKIHAHTTEEILLLTEKGTCTVICNGETRQIPTPAVIWNRVGSYHMVSGATNEEKRSYAISFTPKLLNEVQPSQRYYDFAQGHAMFALPLREDRLERLERLFKTMMGSPIPQRSLLLACVFHQISLYLRKGAEPICSSGGYSYIFKVISELEQLKNTDLTTVVLAEKFHVSKTKLEEDFKRCTGHTIHAFRLRVQLQAARLQLITTQKTLAQIADDCCFTDHSHLIRCFRAEYGMTPGQYRKHIKNYQMI